MIYSITSSARASSVMLRPSAVAVLRLSTSSNFVDSTTGRSAGFSPLRIRPAVVARLDDRPRRDWLSSLQDRRT